MQLGGDISYANGHDIGWQQYLQMIEPLAARIPWMVAYGNHELVPHDSGNEDGIATTARWGIASNSGSPYWYSYRYRSVTFVVISTDSNYTAGSNQRQWLEQELAHADTPAARAAQPWLVVVQHKPMYCSSIDADNSRSKGSRPGAAGHQIEHGLEALYQRYHVDLVLAGHIHEYERTLPVGNNGSSIDERQESNRTFGHYIQPQLPVHLTIGHAGYPHHIGPPNEWPSVPWSAVHVIKWGYCRLNFFNSSTLQIQMVSNGIDYTVNANKDGVPVPGQPVAALEDTLWITKKTAVTQKPRDAPGIPAARGLRNAPLE